MKTDSIGETGVNDDVLCEAFENLGATLLPDFCTNTEVKHRLGRLTCRTDGKQIAGRSNERA